VCFYLLWLYESHRPIFLLITSNFEKRRNVTLSGSQEVQKLMKRSEKGKRVEGKSWPKKTEK